MVIHRLPTVFPKQLQMKENCLLITGIKIKKTRSRDFIIISKDGFYWLIVARGEAPSELSVDQKKPRASHFIITHFIKTDILNKETR